METSNQYYSLRFRTSDTIHNRGDIFNCADVALYVGQTPECDLKLPVHPELADCCYAVIVRDGDNWNIIRQEKDATIAVNGQPLEIISSLSTGDKISFDRTVVEFSISGGTPKVTYVRQSKTSFIWTAMTVIVLLLSGVIFWAYNSSRDAGDIFGDYQSSIYKICADTLEVVYKDGSRDTIPQDKAEIGTGFVTDDGYFVTARHCVEFWLALESDLKQDISDITSKAVLMAISAEEDSTAIESLIGHVTIKSGEGKPMCYCTSDDFTIDRENDNILELGTVRQPYYWRTVVSQYENRSAELGDIAVMRWNGPKGNIKLANGAKKVRIHNKLYGFGYPPEENSTDTALVYNFGKLFREPPTANDCFVCETKFDSGYSGGPVFTTNWLKNRNEVVGLISRTAKDKTLIVPANRIRELINKLNNGSDEYK